MEQSVPKRRHIKFRSRGITQRKQCNIQNTAKVWNQESNVTVCKISQILRNVRVYCHHKIVILTISYTVSVIFSSLQHFGGGGVDFCDAGCHNEELNDLYPLPNNVRVIKSRRMRWAGHVARMGEDRVLHRVLMGKPEGKRPLGRPRHRWEDNIKMDLKEVGEGRGD